MVPKRDTSHAREKQKSFYGSLVGNISRRETDSVLLLWPVTVPEVIFVTIGADDQHE